MMFDHAVSPILPGTQTGINPPTYDNPNRNKIDL